LKVHGVATNVRINVRGFKVNGVSASQFCELISGIQALGPAQKLNLKTKFGVGNLENLSPEDQVLAKSGLLRLKDLLSNLDIEQQDLTDTRALLKATLKELQLQLPKDVFEKIEKDDFVEIYNSDLVSIYKSINFWEITSYSLEEIYTYPYDELFGRDRFSEAAIFQSATKIFTGEKSYLENPAPSHFAWELKGPIVIKIEYKLFSALYDSEGTIVGGASLSKIKMLDVESSEFLSNKHLYS
jgi:hypothetical protein